MVRRNYKRKRDSKQMILDLGQKYYGPIHCKSCDFVYIANSKEDEDLHAIQHNKAHTPLRYMGWQNERIIHEYPDGRIILILPNDYIKNKEKLFQIRKIVDSNLGTNRLKTNGLSQQNINIEIIGPCEKIFLFISDKSVAGFCSAQDIDHAYQVDGTSLEKLAEMGHPEDESAACGIKNRSTNLPPLYCKPEPIDIRCGIYQIWVFDTFKRKGVASRLLDCVKSNFHYGCTLSNQEIAFSTPTSDGVHFIKSYYKDQNFFVYCSNS